MRITNDDKKPSLEEALEHYGVMGMKWGVRRSDKQLARASKAVKKSAKQQVDFYKKPAERAKDKAIPAKKTIKTKTKAAIKKADKAVSDYQAHKRKLKGEAFFTDLFNLPSQARTELDSLNWLENTAVKAGSAAAKQINTEVKVAKLKRDLKNL